MKNTMLLCATFIALTASMGAHAADTAELKVKGTVRPAACILSLGANGTVDYGNIPNSQLSASAATALAKKTVSYAISCPNGAARVALKFADNRSATAVTGISATSEAYSFGLGAVDGKKIGIYTLQMSAKSTVVGPSGNVNPDGFGIISSNGGKTWQASGFLVEYYMTGAGQHWYAWENSTGNAAPIAVVSVSGSMTIQAVIDKLGNLPTGNNVPLDGSATLEMLYL